MLPVIAICIGASVGALSRWGLALWLSPGGVIPWGTLAANLIGGYLIGVAIAVFQAMPQLDPAWRLLLVTGFLGGLTTFSSFSAEVVL
ncbi:MAG: fluoride efflux transporter CrcB, partial [Pseudomonadota bacterium]